MCRAYSSFLRYTLSVAGFLYANKKQEVSIDTDLVHQVLSVFFNKQRNQWF